MQLSRRHSLFLFTVLAILVLAACVCISLFGSFSPMNREAASPELSDESWRITYNASADWGRAAAESLAAALDERIEASV